MRDKISACIITYNHEAFIAACIEGALAQVCSIDYEIVIGDDKSTDGTLAICLEYQRKYPDLIKVVARDKNLGMMGNWKETIANCTGNYIALCEGDDVWNDPSKLEKQVSFLQNNEDFVVTYHNANIIDKNGVIVKNKKLANKYQKDFSGKELQKGAFILTLSMCFRNNLVSFPKQWDLVKNADIFLISLLGKFGKGKFMNSIIPASYRIHDNGIWSTRNTLSILEAREITYINLFEYHDDLKHEAVANHFKKLLYQVRASLMEMNLHKGSFAIAKEYYSKIIRSNNNYIFSMILYFKYLKALAKFHILNLSIQ